MILTGLFYPGNIQFDIAYLAYDPPTTLLLHCLRRISSYCVRAFDRVAVEAKEVIDRARHGTLLVFDESTSEPIELDLRGTIQEVRDRFQPVPKSPPSAVEPLRDAGRGPGRPKLGVIAREVTLLPRHWEWLNGQPGGPSVTLRKLVEEAKRANSEPDRIRVAKEAAYRFMSAMAGDLPGFEERSWALFSKRGSPRRV